MDFQHFFYALVAMMAEMAPYILLGFVIAGLLHEFVKPSTMARQLSSGGWKSAVKAAAIGVPLPLCSCGVLPTAVGMHNQGASKGATTAFLISTPQTGVDSIAATYSLLGLPMAIIRPIAALAGGIFGGIWAGKGEKQREVKEEVTTSEGPKTPFFVRLGRALKYGLVDMVASVGKWLVAGLFVAALITVLLPDDVLVWLNKWPMVAMIAAVVIAVPMYVCATGSIPIALSLMLKGLTPGVAFVFLMAGPAVNFASYTVLNRSMGRRATGIYIATVVITALFVGCLIDYLLPREWFTDPLHAINGCFGDHCSAIGWFPITCAIILAIALINAAIWQYLTHKKLKQQLTEMTQTYKINGMECAHCQKAVEKALKTVPGVKEVKADLAAQTAYIEGNPDPEAVKKAIVDAGFTVS